ncbi:hypothetical protein RHMOL_Rhmol10G0255300 [Rhododendron molle]|uniref:Uncharacterized protein n=1 Tax=Rhododendron molle TaxID=49168 RepID=A0ACC0M782_RHOML|nr:hypothetical protein RHMOL_Rhmol10G0255300 [Rhododendron molle]
MSVTISLQMSHDLGICKNLGCNKQFLNLMQRGKLHLVKTSLSSLALVQFLSAGNSGISTGPLEYSSSGKSIQAEML